MRRVQWEGQPTTDRLKIMDKEKVKTIGTWIFKIAAAGFLIHLMWKVIYTQHMWLNS